MKLPLRMLLVALALNWSSQLFAAEPTPPAGFRAIFNGRDLSGWYGLNPHQGTKLEGEKRAANLKQQRDDFAKHWSVENGELVNVGTGPYATTEEEFGDIEFLIEYKTVAKADSGIYLRGTPQVQIWDYTKEGGKWDRNADKGSGGLFNNPKGSPGQLPLVLADKPFGEWNAFRIKQVGAKTWVWLNDKLVVDGAEMANFWDKSKPLPAKGPIMLQTHGGEIRWRNLFVREIGADEAKAAAAAAPQTSAVAQTSVIAKTATSAGGPIVFVSAFAAGEQGAVHAYQLDAAAGTLNLLHRTTDVQNPFFLALSPDQKFLYSIHAEKFGGKENEHVAAFELVGRSGELKLLNRASSLGTASCYLDVDATGKTVAVANYSTGNVASLPVKPDGSLGEAVSTFQHAGTGADPARQKGPHAHSIVFSPNNKFAYAADLGIDQVLCYRLDPATSKLTPNDPPFGKTPPAAGPRHVTFHPTKKLLYVINELSNSVTVFDWNEETGALTEKQTIPTLPSDFTGKSYCADLKITPDGKYLYGTNRGHDSIAAYAIGDDGRLTLIGIEPSLGKGPQNLAITADGGLLLCANMPGKNVAIFRIDAATGKLKSTGEPTSIPSPSCILLLP